MQKPQFNIWEGVYDDFISAETGGGAESNNDLSGYAANEIIEQSREKAKSSLELLSRGELLPLLYKQRAGALISIVSVLQDRLQKLRILDFGGGFGVGYLALTEALNDISLVDKYDIIEIPELALKGRQLFANMPRFIDASEGLEIASGVYDIIYSSSAIQYLERWQDILILFTKSNAEFILLSDVFAGNIPTFCSNQIFYGYKMKHWFINFDELINLMSINGYKLISKQNPCISRLNFFGELPMNNFQEEYRIKYTMDLIFKKN